MFRECAMQRAIWALPLLLTVSAYGCAGAGEVEPPETGELSASEQPCAEANPCPMGELCVEGVCLEEGLEPGLEPDASLSEGDAPAQAESRGDSEGEGPDIVEGTPCGEALCVEGEVCQDVPSGGEVCVAFAWQDCAPCTSADQCAGGLCVDYGDEGRFCGSPCSELTGCAAGFTCQGLEDGGEGQCVAEAGLCECPAGAADAGLSTTCTQSNALGACPGERVCTEAGLTLCDAPTPVAETCNGVDDDCDGVIDNVSCEDENPCTTGACSGGEGCVFAPLVGEPCDDGQIDTANDVCNEEGVCVGGAIECPTGPCILDASPDGVTCKIAYAGEGAPCDDGDATTNGDICDAVGECAGTSYTCEPGLCELSSEPDGVGCAVVFKAQGSLCDDGDLGTSGDSCDGAGGCSGQALECPAESDCVLSSVPDGSECVLTFAEEGAACSDGKLDTAGDRCDGAGACVGTPYTCEPTSCQLESTPNGVDCDVVQAPAGASCDDGQLGTKEDVCSAEGECAGTAYTCEAGLCELASEPNGVDCEVTPAPSGSQCDDGDVNTKGDACDGSGLCLGDPYSCVLGPCDLSSEADGEGCVVIPVAPGALCDDGEPSTKGDVCDEAGQCSGTPYSCEPAECEASSVPNGEGCDVEPMNAGALCDDGSLETGADVCDGLGACVGLEIPCEPTQCELSAEPDGSVCVVTYEEEGVLCDDGDETSADDACDGEGACVGSATACIPGVCEVSSTGIPGSCEVVFAESGASCDDGDPETSGDVCDGVGGCAGESFVCDLGPCVLFSTPDGEGCDLTLAEEGATCDDADPATVDDVCAADGLCAGVEPTCGDGIIEGLETCEPTEEDTLLCAYGETSCVVCADCVFGPGEVTGYCGDGVTQEEFEACDDGNAEGGDGCSALCTPEATEPSLTVGGTVSEWSQNNYYRGNVFSWQVGETLQSFDVYLTFSSPCQLGLFIHEVQGSMKTVIWSANFTESESSGFINSGHVGIPLEAGKSYGFGVGWSCSAGYYGSYASCDDYGTMQGVVSIWDNAYPGYTPNYAPPNEGGGCSIVYYQNFYFE